MKTEETEELLKRLDYGVILLKGSWDIDEDATNDLLSEAAAEIRLLWEYIEELEEA